MRFLFLIGLIAICSGQKVYSQEDKKSKDAVKAAEVQSMVNGQDFAVEVQSVTPMKGGIRHLSPGYTLRVTKDSLISDLPYFGRAFQANIGSADGGVKFTSVEFEYTVKERKKGGWDITLKPRDAKSVQSCTVTIFDNGNSSIYMTFKDREAISYDGYLK